jgi:thiol-disulfide isomerase/thioredoxin
MLKVARRRRIGWISAVTAVVLIAGLVLGLHFANSPASSSAASKSSANSAGVVPAVGYPAPNGTFTSLAGQQESVASFQGKPTLLWFVSTWCSSCQAGTQAMAQNLSKLQADGVHVVEVELYKDLGQSGPSMQQFAKSLAGSNFTNPDWTFGVSSSALTHAYDPKGYLDIYYLLNSKGNVYYVNSTPSSTMPQLLQTAGRLA